MPNSQIKSLTVDGVTYDIVDKTSGYITGISSSDVTTALGFTPYNSTNPNGYTSNTGTITSVKTTAGTHTTINVSSGAANFNVPTKTSHLTNDSGFLTSFTESDPVFSASAAAGITSTDITNWNAKTSNTGTVTSVRVQATSPVQSSTSSAQSTSLNTTISLADAYGDTKNPYGTKTANYVLAGPTTGSAAAPSFRALVAADIPDLSGTYLTSYTETDPTVPSWAKASSKPSYNFSEIGSTPTSLSGYGITNAYTKTEVDGLVAGVLHYKGTKATISALPSSGNTTGDTWHVTADGSEWAWDGTEWQELGTAVDLSGYVPTSRTVNGKALTGNISLSASDVGAVATETDPVFSASAAAGITSTDISNWNAKVSDTGKWNNVALSKQQGYSTSDYYVPYFLSLDATNASLVNVTTTPTKHRIPKYDDNAYLYSTTPSANDNSTKVATTAYVDGAVGGITVPTKVSDLTNDSGFITSYTDEKVKQTQSTDDVALRILLSHDANNNEATNTTYKAGSLTFNPSTKTLILSSSDSGGSKTSTWKYNELKIANGGNSYQGTYKVGSLTGDRTYTFPDATGTVALTSDIPTVPSNIVNTITTTAGTHSAITSQKGNISFNVPTATSHLTNDSGFITSYTDEKLAVTDISVTSATMYYLIFGDSTTAATRQYDTKGLRYQVSTNYSELMIGYSNPQKAGQITLFNNGYYIRLQPTTLTASGNTINLPNASGTIALTSDIPTQTKTTATLTTTWSSKTQTVSVTGVTASNTVIVTPAPASHDAYCTAGVYCSAQASGTLTFKCDEVPASALTVNILILS